MEMVTQLLLIVIGFGMLIKGADWFVEGASGLATKLGIPQLVIGLTIVAMGTSAPEAAVSLTAAMKGSAGITIGNVVGSNILNILVILGMTSVIVATAVAKSTVRYEIPYMIGITFLLLFVGYTDYAITFVEGLVLWAAFLLYLGYLFRMAKKQQIEQTEIKEQKPLWKMVLGVVVGLILIIWGSDVSVDGATEVAHMIGLSERFIGLTIVALGTSLPELFTSVSAARKGKSDIAIGNIVGSNMFNILFVVGTTALITPVAFAPNFVVDTVIAIASGVLLLVCVAKKRLLGRMAGTLMLCGYGVYLFYLMQ